MAGLAAAAATVTVTTATTLEDAGRPQTTRLSLLLGLLAMVGPYSIDAFFPSLRAIGIDFHVSNLQAQQALTVYMAPYAFMSLVHGSLSDALGRRNIVLIALCIYIVASIGCALSPTFAIFLLFRFMQGLVAGAGQIVGRAIVRDRFSGADAQRLMSVILMIFGLGPALAPVIGGWVHVLLGWRAVFGTMAGFGALLAIMSWRRLPETHPPEKRTLLELGPLLRHNFMIARHPEMLLLSVGTGLCFVAITLYVGSAPAIILDHWGLTETQFAALTMPIVGGFIISGYLSGRLAGRLAPERQARLGFYTLIAAAGAMVLLQTEVASPPVYAQQLLLTFTAIGQQLLYPIISLRVLDLFPQARGAASSMQSFVSLMFGVIAMGLLAPALSQSMALLALAAFVCSVLGWLLCRASRRYRQLAAMRPA
ncbi:MAG: multidrug effflux MFS transporter [Steroidobacterales bacterium]